MTTPVIVNFVIGLVNKWSAISKYTFNDLIKVACEISDIP